ncbi:MAG: hypothetical protein ABGU93_15220 [Acetobacterium sp.]|uniref:hypothetical protein n=1 Tax=Acetobacterium sp. TaxID=1872094 RepID=UPI003242C4F8
MKTLDAQSGYSNLPKDDSLANGIKEDVDLIKNYLTPAFMKKYTVFSCLEDFLNSAGFTATTQQDFETIPVAVMDAWVQQNSKFLNWTEMVSSAGDFYFDTQMKAIKFKSI